MRRTILMSLATVVLLLVGAGVVRADDYTFTIDFSHTGDPVGAFGSLTIAADNTGYSGVYIVMSVTGTINGNNVVLMAANTDVGYTDYPGYDIYSSPSGTFNYDNLIYINQTPASGAVMVFDATGLGLSISGGTNDGGEAELEGGYSDYWYGEWDPSGSHDYDGSYSWDDYSVIISENSVPEPGFIFLFGIGIGVVGLLAWRTKA